MGRKRQKKISGGGRRAAARNSYDDILQYDAEEDEEPALLDFDSLVEASKRQPQKAIVQHHTQFIAPVERRNLQQTEQQKQLQQQQLKQRQLQQQQLEQKQLQKEKLQQQQKQLQQAQLVPQQQVQAAGASLSVRLMQPNEPPTQHPPKQQADPVQKQLTPAQQAPKQARSPVQPALPAGIGQNLVNDMQQLQDLQQELLHWGNKLSPAAPEILVPAK
jgi:hypothetical protein